MRAVTTRKVQVGEKRRRKDLEKRLTELEHMSCDDIGLFGEIFKSVNEFIFEHDLQGRFTGICPRFVGFLGYSREELLGLTARICSWKRTGSTSSHISTGFWPEGKTRVSSSSSPR